MWLPLYVDVLVVPVCGQRYFRFRGAFGLGSGLSRANASFSGVALSK